MKPIGIIAGNGRLPKLFAKKAKSNGFSVHVAAIKGEADPEIEMQADSTAWLALGRFEKMVAYFKAHRVENAVMLGGVDKTKIFSRVEPDARTISILADMGHTHDDALLRAFADALAADGIEVLPSTLLLPELLAEKGCWTVREPTAGEYADIEIGFRAAKKIGELDIGQSVVVAGGSVLAVEAVDGTDATILRGGKLADGPCVVVKVSKPGQDLRFDVPAVGCETIRVMARAGASVLAVEAGRALVFDKKEMVGLADAAGIAVVAVTGGS
ncbi:MAG: UDP-2,3-diacylglucosamine diphosphatase LpxI [Desulfobacterales bacterium]